MVFCLWQWYKGKHVFQPIDTLPKVIRYRINAMMNRQVVVEDQIIL